MNYKWTVLLFGFAFSGVQAAENVYSFDVDAVNKPPTGFIANNDAWRVLKDSRPSSPPNILLPPRSVLSGGTPLSLIADKSVFLDGDVGIHFRMKADDRPSTFGLMWRYRDARNFYAAQIDAASENVYLLRMVNGKSKVIKSGVVLLTPIVWHRLQVQVKGTRMTVIVNDTAVVSADDKQLKTEGAVGLMASPGDLVQFDDFAYRSL